MLPIQVHIKEIRVKGSTVTTPYTSVIIIHGLLLKEAKVTDIHTEILT